MKDAILGHLSEDKRLPGDLKGAVDFQGTKVALSIKPDGGSLADCLELTRSAVVALESIDRKARLAAAKKLLDTYNKNYWREYRQGTSDGRFADVSNPKLTEGEFIVRLQLRYLSVTSNKLCSLGYDDDDLFAGHTIFVHSFDGIGFTDVSVELFG